MSLIELTQLFMTILLARNALDLNPELQSKISSFDNSFRDIINSYQKKNTTELILVTKSFFGYLSLLLLILLLATMYLFGQPKHKFFLYTILILTYSACIWIALSWFSDRGKFAKKIFFEQSKMSFAVFAFPALDFLSNQEVSITNMALKLLLTPFEPLGFTIDVGSNVWISGLILFLIIETMLIIYLLFSTVFLAPIAVSAFAFLFLTIKIANWAMRCSRNRPLSPICFAILIITTLIEKLY